MFSYSNRFKICDPIHGFIRYDSVEKKIIDSRPFQRLRYIRQMGVAYLVYPGATHTRFEHSLGVMEVATRIYDNLFKEKSKVAQGQDLAYWRRVLRAASLCHDMGHLPFSHTAEKSLLPDGGHEQKTVELIQSQEMRAIWQELEVKVEDIIKLSVGGDKLTAWESLLSQIITDDNFGADRIDYLIRDSRYTGVGHGLFDFHQLIDSLTLADDSIGCLESGLQSVEALWVARYLMYARVYHLPKCHIYGLHMDRFMQHHYGKKPLSKKIEDYLQEADPVILTALYEEAALGNLDAKVLMMQEPSFVTFNVDFNQLALLKNRFRDDVFTYDFHSKVKEQSRRFPVVTPEGKIQLSTDLSDFLKEIPLGVKKIGVFVNPAKLQEMKALIF